MTQLEVLYRAGYSTRQLAKRWGIGKTTVWRWLRKLGIDVRKRGWKVTRSITHAEAARNKARRLTPPGPCIKCGVRKTDVHHKDGNPFNNARWNRQRLCRRCHKKIHGQRRDKVSGRYA